MRLQMKESSYTLLICEKFCDYYKPGREEEVCGGYFFLKNFLTPRELDSLIKVFSLNEEKMLEEKLNFLCNKCDFRADGCDFYAGKSSPPCGGYIILSRLYHQIYS